MSAIKKLFERNREVQRLRKERAAMKKEPEPVVVVVDTTYEDNLLKEEINYFDTLLYRDWFTDDQDLIDLLEDANQDVFDHILENLKSYPCRVQNVINENYVPMKLSKKTYTEITDIDMIRRYMKADQEFDDELDAAWKAYIKDSGMSRPDGETEDKLEEKMTELSNKNKLLEEEKNKKSGKYVPPNMRGKLIDNPVVTKLVESIRDTENEIGRLKKQIQQEEKSWYEERKLQFSIKWISMPNVS
jgi:hypothetical protein